MTWVTVGTTEGAAQRRMGWLTICDTCALQVQFEDDDLTAIARQSIQGEAKGTAAANPWWKFW